jgi:hypothetical protein
VEKALGKLLTDDAFRARFFADPAGASVTAGLALSTLELDALAGLPQPALARFSRLLDDRICWLPFEEVQQPALVGGRDAEDARSLTGSDTAPGAQTPRAREAMASRDALEDAGGGVDSAAESWDADPPQT